MIHRPVDLERRHERGALFNARRHVIFDQFIEPRTGAPYFRVVLATVGYPTKHEAASVVQWLRTDRAGPPAVVPRYSYGDVVPGELTSAGGEVDHRRFFAALSKSSVQQDRRTHQSLPPALLELNHRRTGAKAGPANREFAGPPSSGGDHPRRWRR